MNVTILTSFFFFFNDTATTEIYTLSLHDALPILHRHILPPFGLCVPQREHQETAHRRERNEHVRPDTPMINVENFTEPERSEEHTSELQSQSNLVCRLLLEKKKTA